MLVRGAVVSERRELFLLLIIVLLTLHNIITIIIAITIISEWVFRPFLPISHYSFAFIARYSNRACLVITSQTHPRAIDKANDLTSVNTYYPL